MFDLPAGAPNGAGVWLRSARDRLDAEGIDSAALDARMLLLDGLGLPHSVIIAEPNLALNTEEIDRLEEMLLRRLAREPVSRILGWREFYGRKFSISPDVLDPRPDTEVLVDAALARIDESFGANHPCRLLDIGTGTGCIAISLLAERPAWTAWASDVSQAALKIAKQNASTHRVLDRLSLSQSRWTEGLQGPFDLVVSNPPYIASKELDNLMPEVRNHDPELALRAGDDGLEAYREILNGVGELLSPRGAVVLEVGATQAAAVTLLAREYEVVDSVHEVEEIRDLAGHVRVLVLRPEMRKV